MSCGLHFPDSEGMKRYVVMIRRSNMHDGKFMVDDIMSMCFNSLFLGRDIYRLVYVLVALRIRVCVTEYLL